MALDINVILILAGFTAIVSLISIATFSLLWVKNQTMVNGWILWYWICFAIAIVIDCTRVFILLGTEGYYPDLDYGTYIVKTVATFIAFTIISEIHIVLSDYVGLPQKHKTLIRYYLLVVALLVSGLGVLYSTPSTMGESGFYSYQFDTILYFGTFIAYLPVAALIFFRNLDILRSVNSKKVYYKLLFFTILSLFLIAERGFSLGGYSLVYSVLGIPIDLSLLVNFLVLGLISIMSLVMIIRYRGLMESIGSYFSIKKLYILKDNGLLIFDYDFEGKRFKDGLTSEDTLIGGFIYAVTETFKEISKVEDDITSFTSGNRSVLIQRGKFIFGVLIVTEDSPLLHRKLLEFIHKFEEIYHSDLDNWTGEFTKFDRLGILELIFEILRED